MEALGQVQAEERAQRCWPSLVKEGLSVLSQLLVPDAAVIPIEQMRVLSHVPKTSVTVTELGYENKLLTPESMHLAAIIFLPT
jgi:hypothetical protein